MMKKLNWILNNLLEVKNFKKKLKEEKWQLLLKQEGFHRLICNSCKMPISDIYYQDNSGFYCSSCWKIINLGTK